MHFWYHFEQCVIKKVDEITQWENQFLDSKRNVYSKNFRDFCDFRLQIGPKDVKMVQFDSLQVTLGHYLSKNTFCFSWISSSVAFLTKFRCIVVLIIPINWVPRHAQASSFALTAVTRLFEFSIYGNILEIEWKYVDGPRMWKWNVLKKSPWRPIENVWTAHIHSWPSTLNMTLENLLGFESFFIVIL